tara:strand:+ start:732 stop:1736 length:1005 start_codon:yes stop_codon:yes gene_type:complete
MTIDKRMSYVNQDGYKNYTKNSDSVTVPRKFKSRADATPTKLAYITAAEEKQLKKQNKGTPHKGPSGIPSYDSFDAQGGFTSGAAMSAAETGSRNARDRAEIRASNIGGPKGLAPGVKSQEELALRAAAINAGAGQRVNRGFFDSRTRLSPAELAMAKAYRNDPSNRFAKKAYRNTQGGIMNFIQGGGLLGNLLSGLGSFFGLGKRYDEPTYDMSEDNALGLYDQRVNPDYYNDLGNELALGTIATPSDPFANPGDQEIFNERFVDASSGSPYTSSQDALLRQHGYDPYGVGTWKNQEGLKLINNLINWNTRAADGGRIGYANGGLASLFTRRG